MVPASKRIYQQVTWIIYHVTVYFREVVENEPGVWTSYITNPREDEMMKKVYNILKDGL